MRNTLLIIRREFIERVRSRSFVLFTLLTPLFVFAIVVLPSMFMTMQGGTRKVAIVSADARLAEMVREHVTEPSKEPADPMQRSEMSPPSYVVTAYADTSDRTRAMLTDQVASGKLDAYVWLDPGLAEGRTFTYVTRNASDFVDVETMRAAVRFALTRQQLAAAGVDVAAAEALLRPVQVETHRVDKAGKASKTGGLGAFLLPFLLMMMIYMSTIIYGVAVMRSVIEEKTSRVVEVLLSSVTARQLMTGKVLGVGAVGLLQVLIWAVLGLLGTSPALVAARPYLEELSIPPAIGVAFPLFFVLGYLLYSTLYAAVGAMVNSDEEAQQMQWPVLMPLIACSVFATAVIRDPNSSLAFWLSMIPFTSPIIMFVRMTVQMPPLWQVLASVAVLLASIYGVLTLCSRIFRVGILMYGKRPTLPEIVKWIRYA